MFNILAFLLLFTTTCKQQNDKANILRMVKPDFADTTQFVILPFDPSYEWMFKNAKPATINSQEIEQADIIIKKYIDNYNPKQKSLFDSILKVHPNRYIKVEDYIIDFQRYKRQYVTVVNKKGEKEIWVNFFCRTYNKDWKNYLVFVKDGGNCYFNLKVNLSKKICYALAINGHA